MAYYLVQATYTSEAWKNLVKHPQDRTKAIRPVIEKLGGSLESMWFAFGDYDLVLIMQMPDNVSAAAFSLAATAGGALKALKTTALLAITEGLDAMKKAAKAGYRPPGK
ncbi:MAG: GYD domain-containing protein [Verrucomicrobia bacterium]|nr:GYD domain-containing protein [Verrucomicrobiota bacterium]